MNDTTTIPETPGTRPNGTIDFEIDFEKVNQGLLKANHDCVQRTIPLVRMLGVCRQQFSLYEQSHRTKGTEEGNQKAETNANIVRNIDEVLKEFRERAAATPTKGNDHGK